MTSQLRPIYGLDSSFHSTRSGQVALGIDYKLHGLPLGIIRYRDKILISSVWQGTFKLMGTVAGFDSISRDSVSGDLLEVHAFCSTKQMDSIIILGRMLVLYHIEH